MLAELGLDLDAATNNGHARIQLPATDPIVPAADPDAPAVAKAAEDTKNVDDGKDHKEVILEC